MSRKRRKNRVADGAGVASGAALGADADGGVAVLDAPPEVAAEADLPESAPGVGSDVAVEVAADAEIEVGVAEARLMLSRAARLLDDVVCATRRALSAVDPAELDKLAADVPGDTPQPDDQRKRARGRKHPLLVMLALGTSAARHLKQALRVLHPELFGVKPRPEETAVRAAQVQRAADVIREKMASLGIGI